jgi:hypothetical protein
MLPAVATSPLGRAARGKGLVMVNATIHADDVPGLGYYTRRGFVDHGAEPDYARADSTSVGCISKRFDL